MFPILDVSTWQPTADETLGTKAKVWLLEPAVCMLADHRTGFVPLATSRHRPVAGDASIVDLSLTTAPGA